MLLNTPLVAFSPGSLHSAECKIHSDIEIESINTPNTPNVFRSKVSKMEFERLSLLIERDQQSQLASIKQLKQGTDEIFNDIYTMFTFLFLFLFTVLLYVTLFGTF